MKPSLVRTYASRALAVLALAAAGEVALAQDQGIFYTKRMIEKCAELNDAWQASYARSPIDNITSDLRLVYQNYCTPNEYAVRREHVLNRRDMPPGESELAAARARAGATARSDLARTLARELEAIKAKLNERKAQAAE